MIYIYIYYIICHLAIYYLSIIFVNIQPILIKSYPQLTQYNKKAFK